MAQMLIALMSTLRQRHSDIVSTKGLSYILESHLCKPEYSRNTFDPSLLICNMAGRVYLFLWYHRERRECILMLGGYSACR